MAVLIAGFAEKYTVNLIPSTTSLYIVWAVIEEILKFGVVYFIAIRGKYTYEPIDVMIYCVTVALGFAALENALFVLLPISKGDILNSIHMGNLRFIGAALLHVVSSTTIGFALGYEYYRGKLAKSLAVLVGIVIAIAMHAAFNLAIINSDMSDILKTFAWIWAAVIIIIIFFEEIKSVGPIVKKQNTG